MKKAQYFITCRELPMQTIHEVSPDAVRRLFIKKTGRNVDERQLVLQFED